MRMLFKYIIMMYSVVRSLKILFIMVWNIKELLVILKKILQRV